MSSAVMKRSVFDFEKEKYSLSGSMFPMYTVHSQPYQALELFQ